LPISFAPPAATPDVIIRKWNGCAVLSERASNSALQRAFAAGTMTLLCASVFSTPLRLIATMVAS
jgi:hypothetical protein